MRPKDAQHKVEQPGALDYNWQDLRCILPQDLVDGLSSNHPPSKAVLQFVKAARSNPSELLRAAKQKASALNAQIRLLQAQKEILNNDPRVLGTLYKVFDTISSPVRHLPDDIIREILHHAARHTYTSTERTTTVTSLARVCSTWRSVVLSSPHLWSILYLRVNNISHHGIMQYYQAVQTWFCRAGTLPLQLFLYFDHRDIPLPTEPSAYTIKLFLRSLAPWTSRIFRLGIGSHEWTDLMAHFADVEWDLPNLRRLDILGQKANDGDVLEDAMSSLESVMDRVTLFQNSSLLTTFVASQEISAYLRQLLFIPWQQITDISLDEQLGSEFDVVSLLRHCPQLRNVQLVVETRSYSIIPTVNHANLEALQLLMNNPQGYDKIVGFFALCSFPNLTSLCMDIIMDYDDIAPETDGDFGNFVPFPSLRTLIVKGHSLPTPLVINMLHNTPLLQNLNMEIHGGLDDEPSCDVNKLCQSMTLRHGRRNLVPLLEECSFHYIAVPFENLPIFTLDAASISAFVRSRMENILSTESTSSSLKKAVFSGGFRSLSDIDKDIPKANVLRISSRRNFSVKQVHSSIPLPRDLQKPSFSQEPGIDRYRCVVNHTHTAPDGDAE